MGGVMVLFACRGTTSAPSWTQPLARARRPQTGTVTTCGATVDQTVVVTRWLTTAGRVALATSAMEPHVCRLVALHRTLGLSVTATVEHRLSLVSRPRVTSSVTTSAMLLRNPPARAAPPSHLPAALPRTRRNPQRLFLRSTQLWSQRLFLRRFLRHFRRSIQLLRLLPFPPSIRRVIQRPSRRRLPLLHPPPRQHPSHRLHRPWSRPLNRLTHLQRSRLVSPRAHQLPYQPTLRPRSPRRNPLDHQLPSQLAVQRQAPLLIQLARQLPCQRTVLQQIRRLSPLDRRRYARLTVLRRAPPRNLPMRHRRHQQHFLPSHLPRFRRRRQRCNQLLARQSNRHSSQRCHRRRSRPHRPSPFRRRNPRQSRRCSRHLIRRHHPPLCRLLHRRIVRLLSLPSVPRRRLQLIRRRRQQHPPHPVRPLFPLQDQRATPLPPPHPVLPHFPPQDRLPTQLLPPLEHPPPFLPPPPRSTRRRSLPLHLARLRPPRSPQPSSQPVPLLLSQRLSHQS